MDIVTVLIAVAVVGFVLYKQFTGRFVTTGAREIAFPLVLIGVGVVAVAAVRPPVTALGVALLAGELVLAVALGVARGLAFRLEMRDGRLYRRGSVALLAAWVATIAVRVGASLLADGTGVAALVAASSGWCSAPAWPCRPWCCDAASPPTCRNPVPARCGPRSEPPSPPTVSS